MDTARCDRDGRQGDGKVAGTRLGARQRTRAWAGGMMAVGG